MQSHYSNYQNYNKDIITCLIEGGGGFFGSHLCQNLLNQDCFVYCLDNFTSEKNENIKPFLRKSNFKIVPQKPTIFSSNYFDQKIDYIFHTSQMDFIKNNSFQNLEALTNNSQNIKKLLDFCVSQNSKFILHSYQTNQFQQLPQLNNISQQSLNKPNNQNLQFQTQQYIESLTAEYANIKNLDARIVKSYFLYGPKMNLYSKNNIISKIIFSCLKNQTLTLPGDGMQIIYPTYVEDVVQGVIKAIFSQSSKGKIYTLISNHPITLIQFLQYLQEIIKKKLKIKFSSPNDYSSYKISQEILKSQEALGWFPQTNLSDGLKNTITYFKQKKLKQSKNNHSAKQTNVSQLITYSIPTKNIKNDFFSSSQTKKPKKVPSLTIQPSIINLNFWQRLKYFFKRSTKNKPKPKTFFIIIFTLLFILLILAAPPLLSIYISKKDIKKLNQLSQNNQEENITKKEKSLKKISTNHRRLKIIYNFVLWEKQIINYSLPDYVYQYIKYTPDIIDSLNYLDQASKNISQILTTAFNKQNSDPQFFYEKTLSNLNSAFQSISFLKASFKNSQTNLFNLSLIEEKTKSYQSLAKILPDLFAFQDKKIYLFLLQDNNELRPTGGFIEAIALLTVEKGKILDFQVINVYSADKLLKGIVEPPEEIKKYLGENSWHLYDANFSPDFSLSASRTAWFIKKQLGIQADGVISLNYYVFKDLLKYTEPLFLPEYNEYLNSENIIERALRYADINISSQELENSQKAFIISLTKHFYEKISATNSQKLVNLFIPIAQSLNQKNLQIWLPDSASEKHLKQLNWDGSQITPPNQLLEFGLIDLSQYFSLINSNFSFNKSNYYLKKDLKHSIFIKSDGKVLHQITLKMENTSTTESWPAGTYKDYLRFYFLPTDIINSLKISKDSDKKLSEKIKPKDIIIKTENNHKSIGTFIQIPPGQTRILELTYTSSITFPVKKTTAIYSLYLQKQSGSKSYPYTIEINYPSYYQIKKITPEANYLPQKAVFSGNLDTDKIFAVSFSR